MIALDMPELIMMVAALFAGGFVVGCFLHPEKPVTIKVISVRPYDAECLHCCKLWYWGREESPIEHQQRTGHTVLFVPLSTPAVPIQTGKVIR